MTNNRIDKVALPEETPIEPMNKPRIVIPREEVSVDAITGEALDSGALPIRRPHRREWFCLNRESEFPTQLIIDKGATSEDEKLFWVSPELRDQVMTHVTLVRVFVYHSPIVGFALWMVKVHTGNLWYESIHNVLKRPKDLFDTYELNMTSNITRQRYEFRARKADRLIDWPDADDTPELLTDSLGQANLITSADHSFYADLVAGEKIE